MDEQRPAQQWIVKVSGVEDVRLEPGENLEIGRKPLRPLLDDGKRRLDVPDQTKSMSKRHATFAVTEQGDGVLRDLNSTNGTYVVRDDGELMRIPAGIDFPLPAPIVRFQFGDVPVDFLRVDAPDETDEPPAEAVPDLFSYAAPGAQEPDAADMSVDDILDLRAGEPTSAFNAQSVRNRVGALQQEQAVQEPQDEAAQAVQPRDLFADAISGTGAGDQAGAQPGAVQDAGQSVPAAQSSPFAQPVDHAAFRPYQPAAESQPADHPAEQPADQFAGQPIAQSQPGASPYKPAFEPGSVFERVSRGDFDAKQPVIEAGGHTSEQAKSTQDYSIQFDMARYPQLWPFLAMNPSLYDDLYAWLFTLGDKDIDAALENNEGYRDYRAAMGK